LGATVKVGREFSPPDLALGAKEEQNQPLQYFLFNAALLNLPANFYGQC